MNELLFRILLTVKDATTNLPNIILNLVCNILMALPLAALVVVVLFSRDWGEPDCEP